MTLVTSTSLRHSSTPSYEPHEGADNDAVLFETPADLLCPITHELFHEPVINAAGQVYEREAIERALAHRLVDPISNMALDTSSLTTVWPMKSKAAAYRERAVRGCVERLCRPGCRSPVRYLRRAAELCAGMASMVDATGAVLGLPGLTRDVIHYLLTHPSSIYDFQGLSRYAAALAAGGHRDLAAGIYTKLLHLGSSSQQQVEALQGLMGCWAGPEEEEEQQLVERLAALSCEGQDGCRPARFVGVLLEAGLPENLVLRFCEHILSSSVVSHVTAGGVGSGGLQSRNSSSSVEKCCVAGPGGMPPASAPATSGLGSMEGDGYSELLFVYTKLRCGRLEAELSQQQKAGVSGSLPGSERGAAASGGIERPCPAACAKRRSFGARFRRQNVQQGICSAVFAVVTMTGSNRPLARLLKVASVLLLLNPPLRLGDG